MNRQSWILATHNRGKLAEFRAVLADTPVDLTCAADIALDDVEETGSTFEENALLKARHAAQATGLVALADDSGLSVNALNGEPGIYSARYAGADASDDRNVEKLLAALDGTTDRQAHFVCVLALVDPEDIDNPHLFRGQWHGTISRSPSGINGFGYDPIFHPDDAQITGSAAELDADTKNRLSHRARALAELVDHLLVQNRQVPFS